MMFLFMFARILRAVVLAVQATIGLILVGRGLRKMTRSR